MSEEVKKEVYDAAVAEAAEVVVTAMLRQMTGGVDQNKVYLYSGGQGLRDLPKGVVNAILARAGLQLKSEASASERQVTVQLDDGRLVQHTLFWLTTAPVPGVVDDEDEADVGEKTPWGIPSPGGLAPA